jgi:hypothetical protein
LKVAISRVQADNEQTDEKSFILPRSIRDGGKSIDFGNEKRKYTKLEIFEKSKNR